MTARTAALEGPRVRRVRASRWSVAVLVLAGVPRLWAALWDGGIFIPEEITQSLEPAHHFAFGWGLVTHEFRDGACSWLFPGLLAIALRVASMLGAHSPAALVGVAKVGMAALSLAGVWFGMGLARRLGGERAAILAGLLGGACPPLIALGSRCLPEMASAPLIVLAALLLETRTRQNASFAGVVATLTVFLRYPNGLLALGFAVLLLAQHRRADARAYLVGGAATLLLGGLIDWPVWGWPFRALWVYLRTPGAGDVPFLFYEQHLASSIGLTYGLLLIGLALVWRQARGLVVVVVLFVLEQSFVHAKELRFILPVVPLAIALASAGLVRMTNGLGRRGLPTYVLGLACAAQMGWVTHVMTRGWLGFGASDWVIWHSGADYFRTLGEASKADDLCGIAYVGNEPPWTGGYTYLHRAVPIFFDMAPAHLASANYIVGAKTDRPPAGWRSIHTDGGYALFRRDGACSSPPHDWTMNLP
jgi:phosphatidylinositol glycan class B